MKEGLVSVEVKDEETVDGNVWIHLESFRLQVNVIFHSLGEPIPCIVALKSNRFTHL